MRLKSLLLCVIALTTLGFANIANAADRPVVRYRAYRPLLPFTPNWTGFYGGIVAGYGWGRSTQFDPEIETAAEEVTEEASAAALPPVDCTVDPTDKPCQPVEVKRSGHGHGDYLVRGATFGGTFGYNYQFNSPQVAGVEGDFSGTNITGSAADCGASPGFGPCGSKLRWLGTVRGRLGYAAWSNWLFYGTGGWAIGNVSAYSDIEGSPSGSKTNNGQTAGGGAEVLFARNWSFKLEYLYVDLGKHDVYDVEPGIPEEVGFRSNIVRIGLNYRFTPLIVH